MKTSNIIKLIGIICIIIGFQAFMNNLGNIIEPEWIERIKKVAGVPKNIPEWYLIIAYIGISVNALYFVAGVLFLLKKKFSLNLIYIALIISILFILIPLFIIKPYDDIIFVLIRPSIDLALLFGVFRIRKYYYESPNEIVKPFGEITLTSTLLIILTILGIIFASIPILIQGLWIYAVETGSTHADSLTIFYSYFPNFIQGSSNYISLIFCLLAIIISIICLNSSISKSYETLHKIILSISALLLLMNLFQMM